MDKIKDDQYYLEKIEYLINRINESMNSVSYEEYCADLEKQESTMFNLVQISENAKKLSSQYIESHQQVPWKQVYGLRNKIVHDYGSVILDEVYKTMSEDIPELNEILFHKH